MLEAVKCEILTAGYHLLFGRDGNGVAYQVTDQDYRRDTEQRGVDKEGHKTEGFDDITGKAADKLGR